MNRLCRFPGNFYRATFDSVLSIQIHTDIEEMPNEHKPEKNEPFNEPY